MTLRTTSLGLAIAAAMTIAACAYRGTPGESAPPGSAVAAVADSSQGAQLYAAECAGCHGVNAQGTENGQVPAIAGQHRSVIVKQLRDYREGERWDARMEGLMRDHRFGNDAQIGHVAAYLAGMHMAPAGGGPGGETEISARGARVFAKECATCHGARGEGSELRVVPRLAGQQYMYLRRQFHDAVDGRRPNFPRDHIARLATLDVDDIDGLAEYLSELAP
ncbi:MAG: cytochrome c [Steroidobacteraceae bacterium]